MSKKLNKNSDEFEPNLEFVLSGIDIENRIIDIRSEINEYLAGPVIRAILTMQAISKEPINIMVSTSGGNANDALAIYDFLMACPCPIYILANGLVASSGFIVFLAGDVRSATPNSSFMMHSIRYAMDTEKIVKDHEIDVNESKRLNSVFQDIMASRTKRNKKWWYRTVSLVDKYFTVSEAMEVGILTEPKPLKTSPRKKTKNGKQI